MRNRLSRPARSAIIPALLGLFILVHPASGYEQQVTAKAQAIANKLAATETTSAAVVDFTDLRGNVTELGRFLAEELSIGLAGLDRGFEVVDRTHLKALLEEHQLNASGLIDSSTARELGRIAGVGALITGTVTPLGDSVRLAVKVLDTESARIVTSTTANVPKTEAIDELLEREISVPGQGRARDASGTMSTSSGSGYATGDGLAVRLLRCSFRYDTDLRCGVSVASNHGSCEISVTNVSRAVTGNGTPLETQAIVVGNVSTSVEANAAMEQGIPKKFTLHFSAPAETKKLSVLEVAGVAGAECNPEGATRTGFHAQFEDVAVYK